MIGVHVNNPRWQALAARVERWKRLVLTTYRSETRGVELISAVVLTTVWFLFLLVAGDTFSSSSAFDTMKRLGSETSWAIVAGTIAVIQGGGLALNNLRGRTVGTAFAGVYYATVATAIYQANPLTTGWVVYGTLAFFNLWALRRMQ